MKSLRHFLLGTVCVTFSTFTGSSALAEDMGWSGMYGMLYGGYSISKAKGTTTIDSAARYKAPSDTTGTVNQQGIAEDGLGAGANYNHNEDNTITGYSGGDLTTNLSTVINSMVRGGEFGAGIGVMQRMGDDTPFVYGGELSFGYAMPKNESTTFYSNTTTFNYNNNASGTNFGDLINGSVDETAAVSVKSGGFNVQAVGRAGFLASERVYLFGLAGAGVGQGQISVNYNANATLTSDGGSNNQVYTQNANASFNKWMFSGVVGAGAEVALTERIHLRGDYRFAFTPGGSQTINVNRSSSSSNVGTVGSNTATVTIPDVMKHTFRLSLAIPF